MATKKDLDPFHRGDTQKFRVTVLDANGAAVDITTGHTVSMTLKTDRTLPDTDPLPNVLGPVNGSIIDGPNGVADIVLDSTSTAQLTGGAVYYYDVQHVDSNQSPKLVTTLQYGKVRILEDVTITT